MRQLELCQRWREGRASYRPAGEVFDHRRASVETIDDATAKAFVVQHHYAHSYPAARFRAGLYVKEAFRSEQLVGVAVYSVPMNQRVVPSYFAGLQPNDGVELGRFVLLDEVPANAESWSIARMHRRMREALPGVRGVVAYSDPIERRDESGDLVKRGHIGTIYRATNAQYRGLSSRRTLWLAPSGVSISDRALSKVRTGETGERYVMERLLALGASRRQAGEDGAAYIDRLKGSSWLRPMRHPGNHTFTWEW